MPEDKTTFAKNKKSKGGHARAWRAFFYTSGGFATACLPQHAVWQEVFVIVPAAALALASPVAWIFKAALIFPLPLILAAEMLNSAIEAVVDDVSLEYRELAKRAKDLGSAAVFCTNAAGAGVWVAGVWHWAGNGQADAGRAPPALLNIPRPPRHRQRSYSVFCLENKK